MSQQFEALLTWGGMSLLIVAAVFFVFAATSKRMKEWDRQISDKVLDRSAEAVARVVVPMIRATSTIVPIIGWLILAAVGAFVVLGIIGLLLFGIRQL